MQQNQSLRELLVGNKVNIIVCIISLALFLLVASGVVYKSFLFPLDTPVENYFDVTRNMLFLEFFYIVASIGDTYVILVLSTILFAVLIAIKYYSEAALVITTNLGSAVLIAPLKLIFHRARPEYYYVPSAVTDMSFPSGHAIGAICFYGILIYLSHLFIKNELLKSIIIICLTIIIVFIGFSRLYLGVHFLNDVIGGYLLGFAWTYFCIITYQLVFKSIYNKNLKIKQS